MSSVIKFNNVSKIFSNGQGLKHLSFEVSQGAIHGLLGANGAGKSTTMRVLCGLLAATSGEVTILGHDTSTELKQAQKAIGYLPENPPLYLNMTVAEYLLFVARLFASEKPAKRVEWTLEEFGLGEVQNRLIGNLSKGFRQRIGLAQAIIHDPQILVLDEPTVGLDPTVSYNLKQLIKKFQVDKTILLSTHILSDVEELCSEITVIGNGRLLESGRLQELGKKYSTKQIIEVTGHFPASQLIEQATALFSGEAVETSRSQETPEWRFYAQSQEDIRSDLLKFLIEKNCEVKEFKAIEVGPEDIFLKLTQEN